MTDMDSIGSAIACAELYGGVAARGSEINSETRSALGTSIDSPGHGPRSTAWFTRLLLGR